MAGALWERIESLPAEQRILLLRKLREKESARLPAYDVAILGGGLAGLSLALQLRKAVPGIKVVVVEKQRHPVPEAAHKVGESTGEIAAHYFGEILGVRDHLRADHLPKLGLRMFFPAAGNSAIELRPELGLSCFLPLPTYQLDRGRLENYLGNEVLSRGATFLDGCKVKDVELQPGKKHLVTMVRDGEEIRVTARWLVDASGRNTLVRRRLGLRREVGHRASAVWFRIRHELDIDTWSDDPSWRARIDNGDRGGRWLSTNHLMGYGYWVWLIPLASGCTSIGVVVDETIHPFSTINRFERALAWLHVHEPQCAAAVEEHAAQVLDFKGLNGFAYSSRQVYSGDRWCLTGEAGIFTDPLYSPGSDHIAIGNGFIVDLIRRDLAGENCSERALFYDRFFVNLTDIWLCLYERQYSLMGNAQVMRAKIIWDTGVYWGIFGFIYLHDRYADLAANREGNALLQRAGEVIRRMQLFFREWDSLQVPRRTAGDFIDYGSLEHMLSFHEAMASGLDDAAFWERLRGNLWFFERLAGQIVAEVIKSFTAHDAEDAAAGPIEQWQRDPVLAPLLAAARAAPPLLPHLTPLG